MTHQETLHICNRVHGFICTRHMWSYVSLLYRISQKGEKIGKWRLDVCSHCVYHSLSSLSVCNQFLYALSTGIILLFCACFVPILWHMYQRWLFLTIWHVCANQYFIESWSLYKTHNMIKLQQNSTHTVLNIFGMCALLKSYALVV